MRLDKVATMIASVRTLVKEVVLVGIADSTTDRKEHGANNALIGYVMETGSPKMNIPARPFLVPGVKDAEERYIAKLKQGADAAVRGEPEKVRNALVAAGLIAQNSVRRKITTGPFVALSQRTLARRRARGRTGTKPLIDTGQLRNSITYVIRAR